MSTEYPSLRRSSRRRRIRLVTLRLIRESAFPAPEGYPVSQMPIQTPGDVFVRMAPYVERELAESFWILPLNVKKGMTGAGPTVITRGILDSSLVHPREVFIAAIIANAAGVILVHNHPSGDPTPSPEDRKITAELVAAGQLLDIPVYDHVILGRDRYISFVEAGLL